MNSDRLARPGSDRLAQHRHSTISHTIPQRLDYAATLLEDALKLLADYGLTEALQPDAARYLATPQGLRAAASRIRRAADAIAATRNVDACHQHRATGPTPDLL